MAHAAQRISHGVGVLTEDEGLFRILLQIGRDLIRLSVHPALYIADLIEVPVPEHAFIMD